MPFRPFDGMHTEQVSPGLCYLEHILETCTDYDFQCSLQDIEIRFENGGRRMLRAKERPLHSTANKRNQKAPVRIKILHLGPAQIARRHWVQGCEAEFHGALSGPPTAVVLKSVADRLHC